MRKITSVMERTKIDKPKAERAGVPAGSKMLVGDCALAVRVTKDKPQTELPKTHAKERLIFGKTVGECFG